ncbi:hypothetical protein NEUTE1DRAFT_116226 [Neurospora tetrasperma FGSC 2508]|uniref:Uncharacterized protein n=1 Tax=Neurospora tetrasperma (strain FGSC 2508 / ATCC MYA-4615 / P0657) TaxID=510951 RepID=F8MGX0_NEUT8|nr:uncharacterized protein NEUTE1DRAFT_116226 [Neurospora tetrasperma FGSC 2508]EGO58689.1 hypothetical protein NEUTE1DRAFT_116226 [Neurospora tetrasperma FGSC 2508]EGZ72776.1 hypothetical protein NEUTE2DRAFT_143920 [Neurospora tetrasperma FGSC 2509]
MASCLHALMPRGRRRKHNVKGLDAHMAALIEVDWRYFAGIKISPNIRVERVSTFQFPIPLVTAGQRLNGFPLRPLYNTLSVRIVQYRPHILH